MDSINFLEIEHHLQVSQIWLISLFFSILIGLVNCDLLRDPHGKMVRKLVVLKNTMPSSKIPGNHPFFEESIVFLSTTGFWTIFQSGSRSRSQLLVILIPVRICVKYLKLNSCTYPFSKRGFPHFFLPRRTRARLLCLRARKKRWG